MNSSSQACKSPKLSLAPTRQAVPSKESARNLRTNSKNEYLTKCGYSWHTGDPYKGASVAFQREENTWI